MTDIIQPPGRPISYFPSLTKITGSVKAAILLQQISYWTPRAHDEERWIYKHEQEWLEETGFSVKEFRGACVELLKRKLIDKEYDRADHRLRIRLHLDVFNEAIQGMPENKPAKRARTKKAPTKTAHAKKAHAEMAGGMCQKGTWHVPKGTFVNNVVSEITTENTTENTPTPTPSPLTGEGEHARTDEPPWMQEWPKAKRFPADFPRQPPTWFLTYCAEQTPHVDVAHEWVYMLDQTFRSLRTQFFIVARKWMENEEDKRLSNGLKGKPSPPHHPPAPREESPDERRWRDEYDARYRPTTRLEA